ncbi:hypothetical protein CBW16_13000 [Flavobacteriaceae bacterium JJC]|nr:hypothetical protein CBW16_13000 [Flavobacteriaceae bacterium JJC]
MNKIIAILLIGFVSVSCSRNEEHPTDPVINNPLITKMNTNVFYPGSMSYNQADLKFSFEYDSSQKLTKKIGGFLPISGSTGLSGFFTDKIYTSLIYTNNNVTVENFSSSTDFTVLKNSKYYTLNSLNQIVSKEIPNTSNYWLKKQTFNYSDNKLSEIKTVLPNMPYDPTDPNDYLFTYLEKFYYDNNGNLTKTEYFEQQNGINKGEKIVRTFEDYDNSTNPTKRLQLLDDFFYRSLSKNNFKKYTEVHYNYDVLGSTSTTTWIFNYDSNGQIIIN